LSEISLDEQQDVCGGDWWDTAFGIVEGLAFAAGLIL
jgi:hypothetical protein